jgi:uncharacterized membrane protein YkvA (DUF1232 family)
MARPQSEAHGKQNKQQRGPWPRSVNASDQPVSTTHARPADDEAQRRSDELLEIMADPEVTPPRSRWARLVEKAGQRLAPRYLRKMLPRADMVRTELRNIPTRMQRLANQAQLMLELVDDFRAGTYRAVSWTTLAVAGGALLYSISPSDVIPDVIPGAGALDDALVLGIAIRIVQRDLIKYCEYKGYDPGDYFEQRVREAPTQTDLDKQRSDWEGMAPHPDEKPS